MYKTIKNSSLKHVSFYKCKEISGKIIPAIASTNAIAAALQVQKMWKIFEDQEAYRAYAKDQK